MGDARLARVPASTREMSTLQKENESLAMCLYLCVWCALKKRRVSFCCTCAGVHQPLVCEAVCGICLSCLKHSCVFLRFNLSLGASLKAGVLKDKEREPWKVKQPSSMPACVVEMQLLQWLQSSASCGRCYNSYVGKEGNIYYCGSERGFTLWRLYRGRCIALPVNVVFVV